MLKKYGARVVEDEKAAKYSGVKYTAAELEGIYEEYKTKYEKLIRKTHTKNSYEKLKGETK